MAESTKRVILPINSRYKDTDLYADVDGNAFFGPWEELEIQDPSDYELYQIKSKDIGRIDVLAYDFYGDPTLQWVIMNFNNIIDPIFDLEIGDKIKIPSKDQVLRMLMN